MMTEGIYFHSVDIEPATIAYAQDKVHTLKGVSFLWETANVIRIRSSCQYDLIWSAGLLDDLNDHLAVLHKFSIENSYLRRISRRIAFNKVENRLCQTLFSIRRAS